MLCNDKVEDLSRMYTLLGKVEEGLEMMRNVIGAHVKECGTEIVKDEEKMKERGAFVQAMLDLKAKYDNLLRLAFKDDKSFRLIINKVSLSLHVAKLPVNMVVIPSSPLRASST